ncbi:MAG: helix-turn-helix domain-containing protein [Planctomycetota bacterium]
MKKKRNTKSAKKPNRGVKTQAAAAEAPAAKPKSSGARWTFLTNHSHVLIVLSAEPDLVLREVAARVGITERAVQRVVQDLEEGGFIRRERVCRQNRYEVVKDVPLRHPIEEHRNIGDLLNLITG